MFAPRWIVILLPILTVITQLVLPWYSLVLVGLLLGLFAHYRPTAAFGYGLLGGLLLWGGYAAFLNQQNSGVLAERMGQLFGGLPGFGMVLITAVLGGLFAGLATLTGNLGKGLRR